MLGALVEETFGANVVTTSDTTVDIVVVGASVVVVTDSVVVVGERVVVGASVVDVSDVSVVAVTASAIVALGASVITTGVVAPNSQSRNTSYVWKPRSPSNFP